MKIASVNIKLLVEDDPFPIDRGTDGYNVSPCGAGPIGITPKFRRDAVNQL